MTRLGPWIHAMRPRTLPLAVASIVLAAFLAAAEDALDLRVVLLAALTAVLLQILSNLANDYGDFKHGADHTGRQGPARIMHSGLATEREMRAVLAGVALLTLLAGVLLLAVGARRADLPVFLALGAGSVLAAFMYTLGKRPYGYAGLGDVAVLAFFGWAGVLGATYLQTHDFDVLLTLPATSCGLLSVGVLNVNNIRDRESDARAGKHSIPVRIGLQGALIYHAALLIGALIAALAYVLATGPRAPQFLFLLTTPLLWRHMQAVIHAPQPQDLNAELKRLAQTTLLFVLTFGIGQVL